MKFRILIVFFFPICCFAQMHTEYWSPGKKKSEGKTVNGQNDSVWTYWYENGMISARIAYKNGKMNGKFIYYYGNGKVMQAGYSLDDAQVDTMSNYYVSGMLKSRYFYKDAKM